MLLTIIPSVMDPAVITHATVSPFNAPLPDRYPPPSGRSLSMTIRV